MNTQTIPNMYPERTADSSPNFAHQGIPLPLQQLAALVILLNMVGILPCTSFAQCL